MVVIDVLRTIDPDVARDVGMGVVDAVVDYANAHRGVAVGDVPRPGGLDLEQCPLVGVHRVVGDLVEGPQDIWLGIGDFRAGRVVAHHGNHIGAGIGGDEVKQVEPVLLRRRDGMRVADDLGDVVNSPAGIEPVDFRDAG